MAYTITVANQKGGCAKTTTVSVLVYLLSRKYKVLAVDLDSQGNLTELLTLKPIREYRIENISGSLDAIKDGNPRDYILALTDSIHLLPSDELMGTLDPWLFSSKNKHGTVGAIKHMLSCIQDSYDYILIDTPPALGFTMTNALIASNGVVSPFEAGKFCYSALVSFHETVIESQKVNKDLQYLGILCSLIDSRRADNKEYITIAKETFKELCFKTVIKRSAATGRIAIGGIFDNPEIKQATQQFEPFYKELMQRVKTKRI
jgi:chromosome partitioning protein